MTDFPPGMIDSEWVTFCIPKRGVFRAGEYKYIIVHKNPFCDVEVFSQRGYNFK